MQPKSSFLLVLAYNAFTKKIQKKQDIDFNNTKIKIGDNRILFFFYRIHANIKSRIFIFKVTPDIFHTIVGGS